MCPNFWATPGAPASPGIRGVAAVRMGIVKCLGDQFGQGSVLKVTELAFGYSEDVIFA